MAKMGHAVTCLVVVLVIFAQFELGSTQTAPQIGSIYFTNNAANVVSWISTIVLSDGTTRTDPGLSVLPSGQTFVPVLTEEICVQSTFQMPDPTGRFLRQNVNDWCTREMAINCLPDCYWTIDNTGFSVANSATAPPQYVLPWDGPYA